VSFRLRLTFFGAALVALTDSALSPLASAATIMDGSRGARSSTDARPNPLQKPTTCRDQRYVETLVDVALALHRMIFVRVHENTPVAIDAATKEVGEKLIGDREWPHSAALGGREPDAQEPIVKGTVVPLNLVKKSSRASDL